MGALVSAIAAARGHDVVSLSRRDGVDLMTGAGAAEALEGVDTVVDVLNGPDTGTAEGSQAFFGTTTKTLLAAEKAAGVRHHLAMSIVGIDQAPYDHYAGKILQEQLITAGEVPWTIQRSTQWHSFPRYIYARLKIGPIRVAPRARMRPVDPAEVAERLVDAVERGPAGRATDFGGPDELNLADMVRIYARAIGDRGWMPTVSQPGDFGRAARSGALLPGADADLGTRTYSEWIAEVVQR
jgi:uncharacterized protein YbjT (DUF2867 family)